LLAANLGALGTTGMTAYFGLLKHGRPQPGDTVVVSGAAGATGSMVGQIAKIAGCRTIGIAGGPEKCKWLIDDVGYDVAIDYKNDDVRAKLKEYCAQSINVFYDNVGGKILNDALAHIAMHARVAICGGISRYEQGNMPAGPENYFNLIFKRASMTGFIVSDYESEFPEAQKRMRQWIKEGRITFKEDVQEGFDNIPVTLRRLFAGQNFGKQMLRLD
jgi:NADPH-dependent curcumin reductase CurA